MTGVREIGIFLLLTILFDYYSIDNSNNIAYFKNKADASGVFFKSASDKGLLTKNLLINI